jgi:hypothetical protein
MLEIVVENMNKYIDTVSVNYSEHDKYKVKRTTLSKIKTCVGLLYMAGVFKSNRQNLDDLWAIDETGMEIFRSTMSFNTLNFYSSVFTCMTEQLGQQDLKWTN